MVIQYLGLYLIHSIINDGEIQSNFTLIEIFKSPSFFFSLNQTKEGQKVKKNSSEKTSATIKTV